LKLILEFSRFGSRLLEPSLIVVLLRVHDATLDMLPCPLERGLIFVVRV
jgi:hypothetical protein